MRIQLTTLFIAAALSACGSDPPAGPIVVPPEFNLSVTEVVGGLSNPLFVTAPAGDSRLFVVEQGGWDRRKLILTVAQPFANHKGGLNLFGPDGMLYIGLGDGGNAGDPLGNGQNRGTLLGKILRIDVDRGDPYSVPADNPFVGQQGARGEIWAYGLRNPWRFAFDLPGGLLFIADVGQARFEEVDVVAANRGGVNYGWNIMEGVSCFNSSSCNQQGLELPVITYGRSGGACSITGGFVYRGASLPEIAGHYFYSDYCAGFLKSFRYQNGSAVEQRVWDVGSIGSITSFGEDAAGELYMTSSSGRVYRIVRRS